jgi:hypothetical protein
MYFQALTVFVIYVFVSLPLVLFPYVMGSVELVKLNQFLGFSGQGLDYVPGTNLLRGTLFYVTAFAISWVYVRPVVFLYRHTLKVPTEAAFRADAERVSALADRLWSAGKYAVDQQGAASQLNSHFVALIRKWRRCEIETRRDHPGLYDTMLRERSAGALEAVLAASGYLPEDENYIRTCVTAICDGKPLPEPISLAA